MDHAGSLGPDFIEWTDEMNIVFIKAFIGPIGFAFSKLRHFPHLLGFSSENKKGTKDFSLVPLKKYFVFLC